MSKNIKKILLLTSVFIIICFIFKIVLDKSYLKEYNRSSLLGENRYETMVKISKKRWASAKEAVLINTNSISDGISSTPFAYAKDIPMFFVESNELPSTIENEFKRLKLEKIYIVGGDIVISKDVEEKINGMGIETERVYGENSFETSVLLSTKLCEVTDVKELVLLSGIEKSYEGVVMASPASKNNMAIIPINQKEYKKILQFIEEQKIEKIYFVGDNNEFSQEFLNKVTNSEIITSDNRYNLNIKIIEKFYDLEDINEIYLTRGGEDSTIDFINNLALSTVAAYEDIPILLSHQSLGKEEKKFLKENNLKDITEVGFQLVRPKIINSSTIKFISSIAIVVIWIIGIRRIIYFRI